MEVRQQRLVRHLRQRFVALVALSCCAWLGMAGMLVFVWLHRAQLGIASYAWFVAGVVLSLALLLCLVIIAVRLKTTMQVRSRLLSRLEHASGHDELTGLLNRRGFDCALAQQLEGRRAFTLLYLDLDGFKQVNDGHGHDLGDQVLRAVAQGWERTLRAGDVLARLGGDEFVLTTQASGAQVDALCERLIAVAGLALAEELPGLRIGVSIGIAACPGQGCEARRLLASADSAMLAAKAQGKSRYQRALCESSCSAN